MIYNRSRMQEIHINGRDIMLSVYVLTAGRLANNHAYLFDITVCQLVGPSVVYLSTPST